MLLVPTARWAVGGRTIGAKSLLMAPLHSATIPRRVFVVRVVNCPHDWHSPVIVSRSGGIPASVLNTCGICRNYIVLVDDRMWIAICEREPNRLRVAYSPPLAQHRTPVIMVVVNVLATP